MNNQMPRLECGYVEAIIADDEEGIQYDEAIIYVDQDVDNIINVKCPGALPLAEKIVKAVNNHDALVSLLRRLAIRACDENALALVDSLGGAVSEPPTPTET